MNKLRFQSPKIAVALLVAVLFYGENFLYNLSYYFSNDAFVKYFQFNLSTYVFPLNTIRGYFYLIVLGVLIIIGTKELCTTPLKDKKIPQRKHLLVIITGFCGVIAWIKTYAFLYTNSASLVAVLGIDNILSNGIQGPLNIFGIIHNASLANQQFGITIYGVVEECVYAFLLLFIVKRLHIRASIAIISVTILRGILYLHIGTVFSLCYLAPVGIFAAIYLIKTNRFLPLLLGHAAFNYLISTCESAPSRGSFTYFSEFIILTLLVIAGLILTLVTFPLIESEPNTTELPALPQISPNHTETNQIDTKFN